jgi:CRP/FNR family cyclic AMP-dependent transcriptional regulator
VADTAKSDFDPKTFLATVNGGQTVSNYRNHQKVFSQGDPADAVFHIQEGKVKVCVISELGKEAVVALHGEGDFFGEGWEFIMRHNRHDAAGTDQNSS